MSMDMDINTDDDFGEMSSDMKRSFGKFAVLVILLNIIFGVVGLVLTVGIIYFFLAALGVVPPVDVVPVIPFV
jgi:hypothetical protein